MTCIRNGWWLLLRFTTGSVLLTLIKMAYWIYFGIMPLREAWLWRTFSNWCSSQPVEDLLHGICREESCVEAFQQYDAKWSFKQSYYLGILLSEWLYHMSFVIRQPLYIFLQEYIFDTTSLPNFCWSGFVCLLMGVIVLNDLNDTLIG